jgi:hypothetical protein
MNATAECLWRTGITLQLSGKLVFRAEHIFRGAYLYCLSFKCLPAGKAAS